MSNATDNRDVSKFLRFETLSPLDRYVTGWVSEGA